MKGQAMSDENEKRIDELEEKVRKIDNTANMMAAAAGGGIFAGIAVGAGIALFPVVVVGAVGGLVGGGAYRLFKRGRKRRK